MNSIDPLNQAGAIGLRSADALAQGNAAARTRLGQDQFLELMVAQLKNQDPLKPMQNGEFLGQLAQFGTVNGIQDLQKTMTDLSAGLQSSQAVMASSLVGRSVLAPGGVSELTPGGTISGTVTVPASVGGMALTVRDMNGALVRRVEMGAQAAGESQFSWDGRNDAGEAMPAGFYEVSAEALLDGTPVAFATSVNARVESVSLGGSQGLTLHINGLGAVPLAQIKRIS